MWRSWTSNITGSSDHEKKGSQVFLYASMPLASSGGGTSNMSMFAAWLATIPSISLSRTAFAQRSISSRIAASSRCFVLLVLIVFLALTSRGPTQRRDPEQLQWQPPEEWGRPTSGDDQSRSSCMYV